jgi:hypothetical protein
VDRSPPPPARTAAPPPPGAPAAAPAGAAARLTVVTPVPLSGLDSASSQLTTPADSEDGGSWSPGSPADEPSEDALAGSESDDERAGAEGGPQPAAARTPSESDASSLVCPPALAGEGHEAAVLALLALQCASSAEPLPPPARLLPDVSPAWLAPADESLDDRLEPPSDGVSLAAPALPPAAPRQGALTGSKRSGTPIEELERDAGLFAPMPKPDGSGEPKFFCRFAGCGKGYASTDAVSRADPENDDAA